MDLLLSITVSLPTSRRPICLGSIPYFSKREVTTVKLKIEEPMNIQSPGDAIRKIFIIEFKVEVQRSLWEYESNSQCKWHTSTWALLMDTSNIISIKHKLIHG